ncbi:MAG: hypothetical protein FJZ01_00530 [Candidatus Sericytochromatia bacterium]|nr:hypothetical protein [Candidatus Tanganyikabacteria bacterium]
MKRPGLVVALAALLAVSSPVDAEVADDPTERIKEYTDRAIDFKAEGSASYSVKRGSRPISDLDLATSSADPELERRVRRNMTRSWLYRVEVGSLALPLGLLLAVDNFFGKRPTETKLGAVTLPPSLLAPFPAVPCDDTTVIAGCGADWRGFGLAAAGAGMALYGAWLLGELVGESAGTLRPRYLAQDVAKAAVDDYNKRLARELNLRTADVATVTIGASPSPTPAAVPADLPEGEEGSGLWALRKATVAVRGQLGADWAPYLAYTRDIRDFKPGLVKEGDWHVVFAATSSVKAGDIDVTVPRFGGGPTWRAAGGEWTQWRAGTDLLAKARVDSPRALEMLESEYVERQVGWLGPGSAVVLYPFYYRLKEPLWVAFPSGATFAPRVGVEARNGTLVSLPRFRE